jgi:uncharacterized protein (DUF1330 family)
MTVNYKFVSTLLAGIAIGLAAGTAIYAQQAKPAPGYFVAELEITDPAKFQTFLPQVPGTLQPFGGHFLVRPGKVAAALEGEPPKSFAIVAFDSVERAQAWYHSAAYQAIIPLRLSSAKTTAFIAEGVPPQ